MTSLPAIRRGSKLGLKKETAIAALLLHPTIEAAARAIGIATQTLLRWLKNTDFAAAYRAARRAEYRQSMARLVQGMTGAVACIAELMYRGNTPAIRLKAARSLIRLAKKANEIEDFVADLAEALPAVRRARASFTGHGAKFPRKKEKTIAALLANRSVAEAASAAGVGTQTVYRWLQNQAFLAEYAAAAVGVFEPAMRFAQQRVSDAVTVIRKLAADRTTPDETRLRSGLYITSVSTTNLKEDLGARISELETAGAAATENSEPEMTSKALGKILHQRLQRLKAGLLSADRQGDSEFEYVHADDGRPAGPISVRGPGGGQLWLVPPAGCKEGEPVEEQDQPIPDEVAA